MKTELQHEILLQAYLAVNPTEPHWTVCNIDTVVGWNNYFNIGPYHEYDERLYWGRSWRFWSLEGGKSVLKELLKFKQNHWLRIIEHQTIITEQVVAGYDICDGTVVPTTAGTKPIFMGKAVPGCQKKVPKLL